MIFILYIITIEALTEEYAKWVKANGQGKNKQGVRFGQHIHNNYDCKLKENYTAGGFYEETADAAFMCIANDIFYVNTILRTINQSQ